MNKVMKISKTLNTIAGVVRTLFKVAAIIVAVAVVVLFFFPKSHDVWSSVGYTLQLGDVTLELNTQGIVAPEATRLLIIGGLIFSIPLFLFAAKCLHIIQGILTPMSQGKPFDRSVSDSLRRLSFITLIVGGIADAGNMVFSALQLYSVKLGSLFNPVFVTDYSVESTMDLNFLLTFAILFLMSHIFRYGEELQQLSDETL